MAKKTTKNKTDNEEKKKIEAESTSRVLRCDCHHNFQDSRYGKGMRLHTQGIKVKRCTVCGRER